MPTELTRADDGGLQLVVSYEPAPVVQQFIEDGTFVTGLVGPLGSAKTTGGVHKTWGYAQVYPGARIAVIRDVWPNLRDTTQRSFFEWFPDGVAGHYARTEKTFYLHTEAEPAEILFRAMDDKDDVANVLSLELSAAWIDEPQGGLSLRSASAHFVNEPGIDHDLFLAILARLGRWRGHPGMCWLTGNPPAPGHWIAKEFRYDGRGVPHNPRRTFRLHLTDKETNREHLPPDYYERLEDLFGASTPMARRFIEGEWIEFAQLNPFRMEWILYWEERPKLEDLFLVIGVDPAISTKDSAAKTALVVAGQPLAGAQRTTAYVLKALAGHWSPYEQAGRLLELVKEFKPRRIRIEDVAWQRALKDITEKEAETKGIRLPMIDLVKPEGDKLRRASRISPSVESGRVLFGPGQRELIDALVAVPHDKTQWDLVDALGLALTGLPHLRPEQSSLREAKSRPIERRVQTYAVKPPAPSRAERWTPAWRATGDFRQRATGYAGRRMKVTR